MHSLSYGIFFAASTTALLQLGCTSESDPPGSGSPAGTGAEGNGVAPEGTGGTSPGTTGGSANAGGNPSTGGTGTGGGNGTTERGPVFDSCRFLFGAFIDDARDDSALAAQIDFFFPGWMGTNGDTFDQGYVCDETASGGDLEGKIPVVVSYIAAGYAKRHYPGGLNDCNVGQPDLCVHGAEFIADNLENVLNVYRSFGQGYANCYGTTRPIIFLMEPDYFQYTIDDQSDPWTPAEAGQYMSQFVGALAQYLPNAVFSMDISPWVPPNNGSDGGAQWYSNFDMSLFSFVHTSGGTTNGGSELIRDSNNMTWAGVHAATGKPILADTGYGVNGMSEGHDPAWDDLSNLNDRIADGVVSITQYNPEANWADTIAALRSQLDAPAICP